MPMAQAAPAATAATAAGTGTGTRAPLLAGSSNGPPQAATGLASAPPKWSGRGAGAHGSFQSVQRKMYGVGGGHIVPADELTILGFPRSFFCLGKTDGETEMVQLSKGSVIMLLLQVALSLGLALRAAHTTTTVATHNDTTTGVDDGGSAGAGPSDHDVVTSDDVMWTYIRLAAFLLFLVLTVALRWLVLSVSRHDPIAIATRRQDQQLMTASSRSRGSLHETIWMRPAPEEAEANAAQLCVQLWVPLGVGAVLLFMLDATREQKVVRLVTVAIQSFCPVINVAASTLLLGTQCAVIRKHVEHLIEPYAGTEPPLPPWYMRYFRKSPAATSPPAAVQQPQASESAIDDLIQEFRSLSAELAWISETWSWVLGVQICLFLALLANATSALLHFRGVSLLTQEPINGGGSKLWFVQTLPVLWALIVSLETVVALNTYLEGVPGRLSRNCDAQLLTLTDRCQFADEYKRLGVWLSAPFVGEVTEGSRFQALVSFVGLISLALAFPGQITGFLS